MSVVRCRLAVRMIFPLARLAVHMIRHRVSVGSHCPAWEIRNVPAKLCTSKPAKSQEGEAVLMILTILAVLATLSVTHLEISRFVTVLLKEMVVIVNVFLY